MSSQQQQVISQFIQFIETHPLNKQFQSSYFQLGFICNVQALPELVDLELWLPYLWLEKTALSFDNEQQATQYATQVLGLVEELRSSYQQAIPLTGLQVENWLDEQQQATTQASEFCLGYIAAIEAFNEHWAVLDAHPDVQNILQTTILLLSKLTPAEQCEESLQAVFAQLPEPVEIVGIIPKLLTNLAFSATHINQQLDS